MKPNLVIVLISLTIIACNRQNDTGHPGGFYGAGCIDADYTVKEVPKELSELVRKELTEKITDDTIIGKIPFTVSHPVNSENCETNYNEYHVWAQVELSTGVETWSLGFKRKKNGELWCIECNKSLLHNPPE